MLDHECHWRSLVPSLSLLALLMVLAHDVFGHRHRQQRMAAAQQSLLERSDRDRWP